MVQIWPMKLYQTVITSIIWTVLFFIFVLIYKFLKKRNPKNTFVLMVESFIEGIYKFFDDLAGDLPESAKSYVLFLFFYILWNNLVGVFGDLFAYVVPALHHIFRPVTSDVFFNLILAVIGVAWAMLYGFQKHKGEFIKKYVPYHWLGLVERPKSIAWYIGKLFDILLGLFIGFLEFVGEFVKMLSLALRLFWNILAWIILLGLIVYASMAFTGFIIWKGVPLLFPLVVVFFEIFVSFLQALIFSLLVVVYFKLAEASHH